MSAVETEPIVQSEAERVERWRAEELARAGYQPEAARRLAVQAEVDLHVAVDMLARGCPPELALDILL
ncbi:MAG: hypothetical protein ABR569_01525 [Gaiellaceae bacterium]